MRVIFKTIRRCLVGGVVSLLLPALSNADELSFVTVDWPPYYAEDLPENGVFSALSRAALERAGHSVDLSFVPWARALAKSQDGTYHGLWGPYFREDRVEHYAFPKRPVMYSYDAIMGLKSSDLPRRYEALQDLMPFSIAVVRAYSSGNIEFDNADYLTKYETNSDLHSLRQLFRGRTDFVLCTGLAMCNLIAEQEPDMKPDEMFALEPFLGRSGVYVAMSRVATDADTLAAEFDRGLEEIREDGTYEAIVRRFNMGWILDNEPKTPNS